jgi:hypothetical protein
MVSCSAISPVLAAPPACTVSGVPRTACATKRLSTEPNTGSQSKRVASCGYRRDSGVDTPYTTLCITSVEARPHTRHAIDR